MPLIQINADFTKVAATLSRIADALEVIAKRQHRVPLALEDHSDVLYTDEILDLQKEIEREAYTERTGAKLALYDDPPEVPGAESERQAISAAWTGPAR